MFKGFADSLIHVVSNGASVRKLARTVGSQSVAVELPPLSRKNQTPHKQFQLAILVLQLNYKIKILLESIYFAILEEDKKKSPFTRVSQKKEHMCKFGHFMHFAVKGK